MQSGCRQEEGTNKGNREEKGEAKVSADASDRRPESPGITFEVWEAYAAAYLNRYGAEPVRNAKVNGQLKNLRDRLGADEAPQVAAFYLTHPNRWYIEKGHSVQCLLNDAEKLRTEWATGRKVTSTSAQQADRSSTNMEAAKESDEAEARTSSPPPASATSRDTSLSAR